MRKKVNPNLIRKLYENGESTWTIAKKFDFSHSTILRYMKILNIPRRTKSEANKLGFKKGRIKIKEHKIPKSSKRLTKEKAYVLGVLCGDAWLWTKVGKSYQIGLHTIDEDFADKFAFCLKNVYGINPSKKKLLSKVKNWSVQFEIKLCSKLVLEDLTKYDMSTFKTKTWRVPEQIKNSNPGIKSEFLKGLFDSEGSVDKRSNRVTFSSTNLEAIKGVKKILYEIFKIRSSLEKSTRGFVLKIQDRISVETFNEKIGFYIKRKNEKLIELVKNYKLYVTPHKESRKLKPRILELRNKGYSYSKISEETGLSIGTVWRHVNKRN